MEEQYLEDLANTTEVVLNPRRRIRAAGDLRAPRTRGAGGSAGRAAAGALRIGNVLGSAITARRLLGPAERSLTRPGGMALVLLAVLGAVWPRLLAWPLAAVFLWLGLALLYRASPGRTRAALPVHGRIAADEASERPTSTEA
jgi:cardiolipin synthase